MLLISYTIIIISKRTTEHHCNAWFICRNENRLKDRIVENPNDRSKTFFVNCCVDVRITPLLTILLILWKREQFTQTFVVFGTPLIRMHFGVSTVGIRHYASVQPQAYDESFEITIFLDFSTPPSHHFYIINRSNEISKEK